MDFINVFRCGSRSCGGMCFADEDFMRWEGAGWKAEYPTRDRCLACFSKYNRGDKDEFKLYTADMGT
jgi:hypothetical protein